MKSVAAVGKRRQRPTACFEVIIDFECLPVRCFFLTLRRTNSRRSVKIHVYEQPSSLKMCGSFVVVFFPA